MIFDDTNNEYSDSSDQPTDDRICPWCNKRPLSKRSDAKTCGAAECRKTHLREYKKSPEFKAREREYNHRPDVKERRIKKLREVRQTPEYQEYIREYRRRPEAKERARELRIERYHSNPEAKTKAREYSQRPEVKARINDRQRRRYHSNPEVKANAREYGQRPEVKEKRREYLKRPEIKEKTRNREREYGQRPEVLAYRKEYRQRPEAKERARERGQRPEAKAWAREYSRRPEVKEKSKKRQQERGRPYPKNWGGPTRRWEMQGRQCALGWSEFDGRSYRAVSKHFETDHLVAVALLKAIDITDKSIVNTLENIWVITKEKNRGIDGKFDQPLHHWLEAIGEPAPVVDMGRQWYESVVAIIVAKQQAIDPSYVLTDERRAILGLGD